MLCRISRLQGFEARSMEPQYQVQEEDMFFNTPFGDQIKLQNVRFDLILNFTNSNCHIHIKMWSHDSHHTYKSIVEIGPSTQSRNWLRRKSS